MRFIALIIFSCISFVVIAAETLTLELTSGKTHSYALENKPIITFSDNELIIKTNSTETSYQLGDVSKYYFVDDETNLNPLNEDFHFKYFDNVIEVSGCHFIQIISISGELKYSSEVFGATNISLNDYMNGIYVIKTDLKTIKILKK